jgi:hypothetical protein
LINFFFFLGPLEKKSHQNLGSQSAPDHIHIEFLFVFFNKKIVFQEHRT